MRYWLIVCLAVCANAFTVQAAPLGDAPNGHRLAKAWCVNCHLIDGGKGGVTQSGIPPFPLIAKTLVQNGQRERIAKWLANPHGPMANFSLSGRDIADLLAYIDSLRTTGK